MRLGHLVALAMLVGGPPAAVAQTVGGHGCDSTDELGSA